MGNYWMLEVREPSGRDRAVIGKQPDLRHLSDQGFINWVSGGPLPIAVPDELVFQLDPDYGDDLTDFFPPSIPLMSRPMLAALTAAGVDSIDAYPATLLDAQGRPIAEEFFAINITRRIACADLEASDCSYDDPDDPIGVDFDSLVIDEERAGGALLFRLHEAVNGIVVHDAIRAALEPLGLRGVVFVDPEEWVG